MQLIKSFTQFIFETLSTSQNSLPVTVTGSYTASNCDELHAFQGTGGKVIGNMNDTVGKKLAELYASGINPKPTKVTVSVNGMTVSWSVTIDKSNDGKAWVGFTSRGAGCNNNVKARANSVAAGNDVGTAKTRIESTYGESNIEIEEVNDYFYNGGPNSFRQIFYRYTKPKANPPISDQTQSTQQVQPQTTQSSGQTVTIVEANINDLRNSIKTQTAGISIDPASIKFDISDYKLTYQTGSTKIQGISLIFDNISQENLMQVRLPAIKSKNPTFKEIPGQFGLIGKMAWLLGIIY